MTTEASMARMMSGVRELVGAEILLIDKDERVQKGMTQLLSAASLHVTAVLSPEEGLSLIDRKFFSVCIVDLDTPTPGAGLVTTAAIKEKSPTSMVIMLTPRKSFDDAVESIRAGAVDLVLKSPESVQYLKDRVMEAAGRSVDKREVDSVLAEVKAVLDEFLERFMSAERRALDLSDRVAGRDPNSAAHMDEMRVLVVDARTELAQTLRDNAPSGFVFEHVFSGGEALDKCGSSRFHYAMVHAESDLRDLPASMVIRSIKTQSPDVVVLSFTGPAPGASVDLVETHRQTPIVKDFARPEQILERLDELAEAFRAKSRERRYTQAFRERHFNFLRRYVELKSKLDRALAEPVTLEVYDD